MKRIAVAGMLAGIAVAVLTAASARGAEPAPEAGPGTEHRWLQQLVGEWAADIEIPSETGKPQSVRATESIRAIGEYWIVVEGVVPLATGTVRSLLTLGFDPETKTFVGTWIDSTSSFLWTCRGSLDAAGKALALEAEGPGHDGALARYRDVIELKDRDHKLFSNSIQGPDGAWIAMTSTSYRRTR